MAELKAQVDMICMISSLILLKARSVVRVKDKIVLKETLERDIETARINQVFSLLFYTIMY